MPKNDDLKNRLDELFSNTPASPSVEPQAPAASPSTPRGTGALGRITDDASLGIFQAAFDTISLGMVITSTDGVLRHVNDAFCQLLGYARHEVEGKSFQDLTHPEDRAVGGDALRAMVEGKTTTARIEKRYIHHDGHAVWVELNVTLVRDEANRPLHFMTIVQDVSHQHRTATLLEKRVRELNCLNDIGHQIDEKPSLPDFLTWICKRIPTAFQFPEVCVAAIEYDGQVFGDPRTLQQTSKAVGGLRIGQTLVGWLHVAYTEPRDFVDAESALMGSIVSRVSGYIDTVRSAEQSLRHTRELAVLNEMGRAIASELDLDVILGHVYHYTGQLMDTENFYVAMYDDLTKTLSFPLAYVDNATLALPNRPLGNGLTEHIIRTVRPLVFAENVVQHMKDLGIDFVAMGDDEVPLSWIGVPIVYNNQPLGVISLQSVKKANEYGEAELEVLYSIAQQIARAVAYSKQYEAMTRRAEQLAAVAHISNAIANSMGVQDLLQSAVDLTKQQLNLYHAHFYLLDESDEKLKLVAGAGEVGRKMVAAGWEIELSNENSIVAQAARTRRGQVVNDVRDAPDFMPNELLPDTRAELAAPLIAGDQLVGVVDVQSDHAGQFTQEDVDIISTLAAQAAVTLQNARRFEEVRNSENFIRTIIDSTPDWIFVKNRNHQLTLANQAFCKAMGRSLEDVLGKNDLELGYPEEFVMGDPAKGIEGYWWVDQRVLDTGEPQIVLGERNEIDGVPHFFDTYKLPLRDADGRVTGIYGYVRDVTERQELLQSVQQETRNLAILNEMGRDISTSLETRHVLETIYAYTQKFMETESFFIALYDEGENMVSFPLAYRAKVALNLPTRELRTTLTDYIIRTKRPLLFSENVSEGMKAIGLESVTFGDSKPAQSWLGVPLLYAGRVLGVISVQSTSRPRMYTERERDVMIAIANQAASALAVSEQVKRLQETATNLRTQETLMRAIIDATPDWIFIKDRQHRYTLVNKGYADDLHIPVEAFIGKDDLDLGFPEELVKGNPEKGIRGFWSDDDGVLNSGEAKLYPNDPATIDGVVHIFNTLKTPLLDENGQVWAVLAFSRDVTEREAIFAQTRQQAEYLAALNDIAAQMNQAASEQELLGIAAGFAAQVSGFDLASVGVLDAPLNQVTMYTMDSSMGKLRPMGASVPVSGSASGLVAQSRRLMAWPGDGAMEDVMEGPMLKQMGMQAMMSAPLLLGSELYGVLNVASASLSRFDDGQRNLLRQVASLVSASLQARRLLRQVQERARQEQALREITANVRSTMDTETILRTAVRDLGDLLGRKAFIRMGEPAANPDNGKENGQ